MKKIMLLLGVMSQLGADVVSAQVSFLNAGHADIGVAYVDGRFEPHWHVGAGAVVDGVMLNFEKEYEPHSLVAMVRNDSEARPASALYDPMGVAAGENFWRLPASGAMEEPELGISTEELDFEDWVGQVTFTLMDFSGPGQFSLYRISAGAPVFLMTTSNGLSVEDRVLMFPGAHAHYNWAFTAPGYYELTFLMEGMQEEDGLISAEATFGFYVVPEPSMAGLMGAGMLFWVLRRTKFRNRNN